MLGKPVEIAYNTELKPILYPEYGRAVQEMLLEARHIPDDKLRQATVEAIVRIMMQLAPSANRNVEDYREKLWNHVFAIAGYDLDVMPPAGVQIRPHEKIRPPKMDYPPAATRFRHYGVGVQKLIQKAIEMPDGPKKEGFVEVIASYMKLAYKTWNREHYVSDDVVKDDLESLSEGKLILHEGHSSLDTLAASAAKREKELKQQFYRNKSKNGKGGNKGGNNKQQYRKKKK